jgi:intracellular multiplication protein IcmL
MQMQHYDVMMLVLKRNAYYRKLYLYALAACVLGFIAIVGLTVSLYAIMRIPKEPLYFPTNAAGELINEMPLNQPNMSIEQVKEWVTDAVEASSTFNFVNYRSQLQHLSSYFTDYGWSTFKKALNTEGTIQAVLERRWIMTAHVSGDITLVQQGLIKGQYAWKFTMPLLVTTWGAPYDERGKGLTPLKVTVIVQREPLLQSYRGLGIVQYYSYNAASAPTGEEEMTFDQT